MMQVKKSNKHVHHLPKSQLAECLGWIGAVATLSAYALLSLNLISGNSVLYHLIFLTGCVGLAIVTYRHRAFQSVAVNVIFILLGLVAITRIILLA